MVDERMQKQEEGRRKEGETGGQVTGKQEMQTERDKDVMKKQRQER